MPQSHDEIMAEIYQQCQDGHWDYVRRWLEQDPSRAWCVSDKYGGNVVSYFVRYHNMDLLNYVVTSIEQEPPERQEEFSRRAFEKQEEDGFTLAHWAAIEGYLDILQFLVRYSPSGVAILERGCDCGWTSAHCAANNGEFEILKFILTNAPSGVAIMNAKTRGKDTVFDLLSHNTKERFLKMIGEVGLQHELEVVSDHDFEANSLVSLVLMFVEQQTELLLYRSKEK